MSTDTIREILLANFPFTPTPEQSEVLGQLAAFLTSDEDHSMYVLRGYAGTGKTTLIGALVNSLPRMRMRSVLLAPTGRAAKVMSNYSGKPATTIHRKIYRRQRFADGVERFNLNENMHTYTVFIVDEVSMIAGHSDQAGRSVFGTGNLLDDLIEFVYTGAHCRLILVGDTAQLPPVGTTLSPALDADLLRKKFFFHVGDFELTTVLRQQGDSGILKNATEIRNLVRGGETAHPHFYLKGLPDVVRVNGHELEEALNDSYGEFGYDGTIVITRSNKRAYLFNQQIRVRIKWQEDKISSGDLVMVVKNNYFWLDDNSKPGFVANGDILEITRVLGYQEMYGFEFAEVIAQMVDYPEEPEMEVRILLDTLSTEAPALPPQDQQRFLDAVMEDYEDIPSRREKFARLKQNPYWNALQIKFAYAVTCHKAQGGQWPSVFVDQGYITEEMMNTEYQRWLYTAVTRATKRLYLVNFHEDFFLAEND